MNDTGELLMGIDIGTTNVKCAVYDLSARPIAVATRSTSPARAADGRLLMEAVWGLTESCCSQAVAEAGQRTNVRVAGVAVSGVGCVPVLLDAAGHSVDLHPAPDALAAAYAGLTSAYSGTEFQGITGYPLEPASPLVKLIAAPESVKRQTAAVLSVSDYIAFRLTGVVAHEPSTAASLAAWDTRADNWWFEVLQAAGWDSAAFGPVMPSAEPIGTVAPEPASTTGLATSTIVFRGGHDYLAAALAADLAVGTEILEVAGTADILASFHRVGDGPAGPAHVRAMHDRHVVPGQVSYMIEAVCAGQIEWLREEVLRPLGGPAPELGPLFDALDDLPPSFTETAELFIPHLFGRVYPSWDRSAHGALLGLSTRSTGMTLLRSIIEGLCFQSRQIIACQQQLLARSDVVVKVVGGGSRSPAWNRIRADVLAMPTRVPRITEASALGAALLAGVGLGAYSGFTDAAATAAELGADTYEPDPRRAALYDDIYNNVFVPVMSAVSESDSRLAEVLSRHGS